MLEIEKQTIDVVKRVSPAVVSISVSKFMPKVKQASSSVLFPLGSLDAPTLQEEPLHVPEMNPDSDTQERVTVGGGSGFFVHPDGLILTNKHVIFDQAAEYTVTILDKKEYQAKVISRDPVNDVGVLKIQVSNVPIVKLGDSDKIQLGQTVIAIGNALGMFSNTVSKGIVSGLGRKISASMGQGGHPENLHDVIQTDVAINQGNSGGPLINLEGEVIGINTAVMSGAQNIGFALPINWAKADLEDIVKFGRIIRPYIGLRYVMLNRELKEKYSLPVDYGALVVKDHVPGAEAVVVNSPAHKAGIMENDVVLDINGEKLDEKRELADVIHDKKVGDEVEMTVIRNGQTISIKAILAESK